MSHEQNPLPGEAPGPPGRPPPLAPYTVWAVLFILVPLVFVAYYAFTDDNFAFTLENIQRFFVSTSTVFQEDGSSQEVRTYLLIFWRSLKLAIISTLVCWCWPIPWPTSWPGPSPAPRRSSSPSS